MTDSPFEPPAVVRLEGVDAAVEAPRIRAGEPWAGTEIAGLQYYDYDQTGLDGEPVRPVPGTASSSSGRPTTSTTRGPSRSGGGTTSASGTCPGASPGKSPRRWMRACPCGPTSLMPVTVRPGRPGRFSSAPPSPNCTGS